MKEHEVILAQAKALGLKLSEDGQSWLPIDANSASESVADAGMSENLDSDMKLEPKLSSLGLNYLALFGVLGLSFGLATGMTMIIDNFLLFFLTLLILPIIHLFIISNKLGKEFNKGVGSSVLISLPISIWEYLNSRVMNRT